MARTAVSMARRWKSAKGAGHPLLLLTYWVGRIGVGVLQHMAFVRQHLSPRKCHAVWNQMSTRTTVWEALYPKIVWLVQWLEHLDAYGVVPFPGGAAAGRALAVAV